MFKQSLTAILILFVCSMPVYSLEFDTSIDAEIKSKYNSKQLEYDILPNLPKVNTTTPTSVNTPKASLEYSIEKPQITKINPKNGIKIDKWTKFNANSNQTISDKSKAGTNISFTTTAPVYKKNITIPAGSKLYGTIVNTHPPQVTGNGGLIIVKIDSLTYNGKTYPINAKITKANYKKIFFNRIKGKRQYLKGVSKQVNKGENFYKKSNKVSSKMSSIPIVSLLSPLPTVVGAAGYTIQTVISPLTGLTNRGGSITIPAGSSFEIKLLDNAYINF